NELVFDLKAKGYGLYLLSNASRMQKDYWPNVVCSICFDGVMVSAFEKLAKPDLRFYQRLLDRYDLKAEECLFVDDRKSNIEAAKSLGIDVYHFDGDAGRLRSYIERIDESFIEK
ncbi:MAG: HAD-IA family hydrolase, partial [Erysipelotrichaceae bacterium]|nr:HAD-IA family hydrolase [Erysipelotrichaceae bacterium]